MGERETTRHLEGGGEASGTETATTGHETARNGAAFLPSALVSDTMLRLLSMLLALPAGYAGHCYSNMAVCQTCVADARGSPCAFCGSVCQMASDACSAGAVTTEANCPGYTPPDPLPGEPFFQDVSSLLATNPAQLNYGVAVTDTNGNGKLEFVVAGFGAANQAFEWDAASGSFHDVATATLQDASSKAIGVAACDIDGDGYEELYILNTDQYSGSTSTSDRLIARDASTGEHVELFALVQNQGKPCRAPCRAPCPCTCAAPCTVAHVAHGIA